ncbi:MAG: RES family NAD+ phosphorylase [Bacteroidia bacterium]|nr:RES family NAD+ phosphorylase [Bacteroidia bacterium]
MIVYRITKKEHAALDGMGGLYGPGRWHRKGNLVVYASEHASLAAWEKIVHMASFENFPNDLLLVKIEIPDEIEIRTVPQNVLAKGWDSFPFISETVSYGSSFLQDKVCLALKVPSAIIPDEFNIILNPLHPDIQGCKVISAIPFVFDKRISKYNS